MREIAFHVKHEAHFYPQAAVDNVGMIHITPFRHLGVAVDRSVDKCCGNLRCGSLPWGDPIGPTSFGKAFGGASEQVPQGLLESSSMGPAYTRSTDVIRGEPIWVKPSERN